MKILNSGDIMETIEMLTSEHLDVRTVTMGISLLDCIDPDGAQGLREDLQQDRRPRQGPGAGGRRHCRRVRHPHCQQADQRDPHRHAARRRARRRPRAGTPRRSTPRPRPVGVNFIGGYGALVHKGFSAGDTRLIESIPRALAETELVCSSSINVGSTKSGINMDAVALMGRVIRETAERTRDNMCMGDAKLVVFCNAPEDNPFMAGAFHGPGEPDCELHVGRIRPRRGARRPGQAAQGRPDGRGGRAGQAHRLQDHPAGPARRQPGQPSGSACRPASSTCRSRPTPAIGDSVANILEEMGLESCGCCGTTACLALLNDAVKKGGVMASNHVGGLSGAFIPVSEDDGMIKAAECGSLSLEKLEAMTAVCSVGIDMVVIPGDTPAEVISALIADEAAIGMVNSKTTAVRVIPAIGHEAGDVLDFGGLLGHAPIMPISQVQPRRHDPPRRPHPRPDAGAEELSFRSRVPAIAWPCAGALFSCAILTKRSAFFLAPPPFRFVPLCCILQVEANLSCFMQGGGCNMPEKNSNPFTKMLVGILELGLFGYAIVSSFVKGWATRGTASCCCIWWWSSHLPRCSAAVPRAGKRSFGQFCCWPKACCSPPSLARSSPGCGDARLVLARLLLVPVPVGLSFHPAHRFFPQTSRAARLNLHKPPLPCAD